MKIRQSYKHYFLFAIIAILAFWQILLFVHPAKWDIMDCYLPWRFHVSECLQNGKLPLWNPYQDLGYPIHSDPSSGAWYPFVWIIGYLFGYNVYTIGLEMCLHVFIAAIGFYKLCKTLKLNANTAFIAAVCYMLCGIFIGNAQHITYSISACWIPFIINYYIKLSEETTFINSLKAALPLFMLLTGGYPAFTIMLFYLLLSFFIYYSIKYFKEAKQKLVQYFLRNALFFAGTILLSIVMLVSIYQATPFISRTNDFTIGQALFCPFSPQSSISFLLPFTAIKNLEFFNTDLSMTNAYFGLFMFVFFILSLFIKKPFQFKILLFFGIFSLLASFGEYTPVRKFLFDYIPLMNLFRFPSAFRLFTIIGAVICGAFWLENYLNNPLPKYKKQLFIVGSIISVLFIGAIAYSRTTGYLTMKEFVKNELFTFSKTSFIWQHITFQAATQLVFIALFLILIWKFNKHKFFTLAFTLLIVIELLFNTQLNTPYTAYSKEFKAVEANNHLKKFPKGFPQLPDIAIANVDPSPMYVAPFWKNVNIFQKLVSSDGFNSFAFTGHQQFRDDTPQLYSEVMKNKIVFLSDKFYDTSQTDQFKKDSSFTSKSLFFDTKTISEIKTPLTYTIGDTAYLTHFAPDSFIVNTSTKQAQLLTLLQNNYTGWKAYVNDKETPIYMSNKSLITIQLPAGNNKVNFIYKNSTVKTAFYISIITLLITLSIIIIKGRVKK